MAEEQKSPSTSESNGNKINFGERTIDKFRSKLSGGGARPNLFEVIGAFPPGLGISNDKILGEDIRFLIKAASLPASTVSVIDIPFRGRNLKIAGDRTFEPWSITVINDTNFKIRNAFERWINFMNKLDDNAGVITPASYQADWEVVQLGRGTQSIGSNVNFPPTGEMPMLKKYSMKGCFPTSVSAIDLSYDSSDTIEEFTVDLQVQWFDILNPSTGSGDGSGTPGGPTVITGNMISINSTTSSPTNTGGTNSNTGGTSPSTNV